MQAHVLAGALDPAREPATVAAAPCPALPRPSKAAAGLLATLWLILPVPRQAQPCLYLGSFSTTVRVLPRRCSLRKVSRTRMQRREGCRCWQRQGWAAGAGGSDMLCCAVQRHDVLSPSCWQVSELGYHACSGLPATCHCLLPSRCPAASGPWPTRHRSHRLTLAPGTGLGRTPPAQCGSVAADEVWLRTGCFAAL